ncbi:flagellar biosynthetic protein FliO [Planomonospora venezuelensis]|uniref:Flagellar protein n=1 Tax=Planomonospora venezuelensis TaxID=1999 RepID=A0A841DJM6_PLAVE|nr:flagellar biosynthetic protein FliO [Planomonospora venezuelensis]MBB5967336.1 flagellar protein FliO/FliZ [Planomonospora venezuelensis]GIN04726.1 hypothetical protein Pve01_63840 [Planomonospora venezuelensis]
MIETVLRITFSLLVVLLLVWGLSKVARKPLAGRGGGHLSVLARQQLTRNSSVAIVRVTDRALVLGVTDGQVTLLTETDLAALEAAQERREQAEERIPVSLPAAAATAASSPADDAAAVQGLLKGPLAGSALSPQTWKTALEMLRERTAR